jgi:hypothetical protein
MKKQVVAIFTEGFADLTEGKIYDVVCESDFYVTIVDDEKDEHTYPKALFSEVYDINDIL